MPAEVAPNQTAPTSSLDAVAPVLASVLVLLTLVLTLAWSHHRALWSDELLEFFTDTKPSARAIIYGQMHFPFSLEPPTYHLLSHLFVLLLGPTQFAIRLLPALSLAGAQVCTYAIARRLQTPRTGLLAMFLVTTSAMLDYGAEARCYSFLAFAWSAALLSWIVAIHRQRNRGLPLVALYIFTVLTVTTHFFGVFLLLPLLAGEAVRSLQQRHIDRRVALTLLLATASAGLNLPFQQAAAAFRVHYFFTDTAARLSMLPFTFVWYALHFRAYSLVAHKLLAAECLATAVIVALSVWAIRHRSQFAPGVLALLLAGVWIPAVDVAFAHWVTHAYWPRYSLPAVVPLATLIALALGHRRWLAVSVALLASLFAVVYVRSTLRQNNAERLGLIASAHQFGQLPQALAQQADPLVYVQDISSFLVDVDQAAPQIRPHLALIGDNDRELRFQGYTVGTSFGENIRRTTKLNVATWTELQAHPQPRLFLVYSSPYGDWISKELTHAEDLGPALGGELFRLSPHP